MPIFGQLALLGEGTLQHSEYSSLVRSGSVSVEEEMVQIKNETTDKQQKKKSAGCVRVARDLPESRCLNHSGVSAWWDCKA